MHRSEWQMRINTVAWCLWCQTSSSELSFVDVLCQIGALAPAKILKPRTYPASPLQRRMNNWYLRAMLKRLFSTRWPLGDTTVISNKWISNTTDTLSIQVNITPECVQEDQNWFSNESLPEPILTQIFDCNLASPRNRELTLKTRRQDGWTSHKFEGNYNIQGKQVRYGDVDNYIYFSTVKYGHPSMPLLDVRHGWVITFHSFIWMQFIYMQKNWFRQNLDLSCYFV